MTTSGNINNVVNEFQYSLNKNNKLTFEQRKFYEENGFLIIRNLVKKELLEQFRQHFVDICEGRVAKGFMTLMKDISLAKLGMVGEALYNKVQDILWDEVFEQYCFCPEVLEYVESFIGCNINVVHSMLINKPPDPNTLTSRHPLHQDLHYFPFRPANKIVAAWTAMEKVTTENGCLIVLPGTHKGSLLKHDYPNWKNGVNKAYHGVKGYDDHPFVSLHMDKGDTVFFHPLLIHGSGPNLTKGFRKAIICHFASTDCYFIDVTGTIQENIRKEVEEVAQKRGYNMNFIEVWKVRSRLVKGVDLSSSL
ncbi:phytanoyl-CoA dioxygenase, peroxisomal-like isoform X1 [Lycorma delicatula]|uniref:phytanoyl-CoA dioxygenase, peroxisomal-like isoform X1 n=1 Tax=Lycorma delicatula TaxID=130591 RepID=UPI003F515B5B